MSEWNTGIIDEFRENEGTASGWFEGKPLLLLHHTGAKSGAVRVAPLMYHQEDEGDLFIFASKAGGPSHPDWFHNLKAHPEVTIEVGTETRPVTATEIVGSVRDEIYERHAARFPNFAEYQEKTDRVIPVFQLTA